MSNWSESATASDEATHVVEGSSERRTEDGLELPAGTRFGRYVLGRRLGVGGMGVVYAAYDGELRRNVALKLLRPDRTQTLRGRERLLREAQTLAQLSHPNVITVHDAGIHDARVFVVMELVDGRTLREWLKAEPRSIDEIVAVFVAAGHGLAAAHRAGLVHRDVKPDNLLIGDDGRVRVVDFGLAVAADDSIDPAASSADAKPRGLVGEHVTEYGAVVGTPAFMAPEQAEGQRVDALSDQYSFCVTLWQSLTGELPFEGATPADRHRAKLQGLIRRPPTTRTIPSELQRLLIRGMSVAPSDRWPDMPALLARLQPRGKGHRQRWLIAGTAALTAGTFAWAYATALGRDDLCRGGEAVVAEHWSAEAKQRLRTAFDGTALPYAKDTAERVERHLDAYFEGWSALHRDACEATHLRGERSDELLDAQMSCLDRQMAEARSLVDLFEQADAAMVERAVAAVGELPEVERCADLDRLRAGTSTPPEPAIAAEVDEVRTMLAASRAWLLAGRYRDGLAIVEQAIARAEATGFEPLVVEAWLEKGVYQYFLGEYEEARRTLTATTWRGTAIGHDEIVAAATTALVRVEGEGLEHYERASQWVDHARAAVERIGEPSHTLAEFLNVEGQLLQQQQRLDEALDRHRRALDLLVSIRGREHPEVGETHNHLGNVLWGQANWAEAEREYTRALEITSNTAGEGHPLVAAIHNNLGNLACAIGDDARGIQHYERALAIQRAALGERHPTVARTLANLAVSLDAVGRLEEAENSQRASLDSFTRTLGPDHVEVGLSLISLGDVLEHRGRTEDARRTYLDAAQRLSKAVGEEHMYPALAWINLGGLELGAGHSERALELGTASLNVLQRVLGDDHPHTGAAAQLRGQALHALGRLDEAIAALETAVANRSRPSSTLQMRLEAQYFLATALTDAGQVDRARALIEEVGRDVTALPVPDPGLAAAVQEWHDAHAPPSAVRQPSKTASEHRP